MIILPAGGLEQAGAEVTTTIGMFLTQVIFYAAGLFIASFMKTYKAAVRIGGCFVLVVYTIAIIAEYTGIHFMDYLTPLRYFDVYEVDVYKRQHLVSNCLILPLLLQFSENCNS